jgi:VanZ family protein
MPSPPDHESSRPARPHALHPFGQRAIHQARKIRRVTRWSWLLMLYVVALLAVAILPIGRGRSSHQRFFLMDQRGVDRARVAEDALLNVAVFVPFGLLAAFGTSRRRGAVAVVIGTAALLSLGIETLQHFVPWRYSSWIDVISNSAGAAIGALVGRRHSSGHG